jgi:putative colanic acid biosynthesis acetyltransferase WcaF
MAKAAEKLISPKSTDFRVCARTPLSELSPAEPAVSLPKGTAESSPGPESWVSKYQRAGQSADPYLRPSFSFSNRMRRLAWSICWTLLFRPSPRPFHAWRAFLLRCFGARLGPHCHFYPRSRIWAPWNLLCADGVSLGDEAEIYNPSPVTMESHAIVSQQAYICGATHDYNDPSFPLISFPMKLGAYSWVCARASVSPGVNLGDGAVLGLGSVATRDLKPWTVYAGVPAQPVKQRVGREPNTPAT